MLKIEGGTIHDPANGIEGVPGDIWIDAGRIVSPPEGGIAERTIDARGLVVMPGGVDMHCHIAGPKVNTARKMRPEERSGDQVFSGRTLPDGGRLRSGTLGSVPSTFVTGYKYAGMGYTTAFDAAVSPFSARHVHEEFADTPCIDKGFYVLVGNNHYVLNSIQKDDPRRLENFLGWLLNASKSFAPKLVNPGGVELWKQRHDGNARDLDQTIDHFDITPRQIVMNLVTAANNLRLPHPVHIHCNNLGMPGNWTTTLETMKCLEGQRGHLTHIQFHSYGGGGVEEESLCSKVAPLADYVNENPNLSVDVGQVMFGDTTSMTGDGPLGYYLHQLYGNKWYSSDLEVESGCGISPIKYRNKSFVHSLQWAVGLEWYLMVKNPWQIAMSTDHPNGGSFLAYPQIIRLLMDSAFRREAIGKLDPRLKKSCTLFDIDREYSLNEIAIITRAAPARMLGLANKGQLGIGADADITIYLPNVNQQVMFELPLFVIKSGEVLIERCEIVRAPMGRTIYADATYDQDAAKPISKWFDKNYSVSLNSYAIGKGSLMSPVEVSASPLTDDEPNQTK